MKSNCFLLVAVLSFLILSTAAQTPVNEAQQRAAAEREQRIIRAEAMRRNQEESNRMRAINEARQNVTNSRSESSRIVTDKPALTKSDIDAISINPEDAKPFTAFLKQPRTGILRLHNATICSPEKFVVQASGICPNNVQGKATSFSFREKDYASKFLSDILFTEDKLLSSGVFTIGLLTNLGSIEINNLTLTSSGIWELTEYQPADDKAEIERQYKLFTTGVRVGENTYRRQAKVVENAVYVLRSIAYKGKVFSGSGAHKVNLLGNDKREDVTIVFKVIKQHQDNSIMLIWKELDRKPSPKIVLESK